MSLRPYLSLYYRSSSAFKGTSKPYKNSSLLRFLLLIICYSAYYNFLAILKLSKACNKQPVDTFSGWIFGDDVGVWVVLSFVRWRLILIYSGKSLELT